MTTRTQEIVARLRAAQGEYPDALTRCRLERAAAEIERLAAELERARGLLERIRLERQGRDGILTVPCIEEICAYLAGARAEEKT